MGATVIKLTPNDSESILRVTTFDDANDEFSELKGKGRARRAKRRTERTENKVKRKTERVVGRRAVKTARQQGRIAGRSDRKASRQAMRTDQQGARMARRTNRLDQRQARTEAKQTRKDTRHSGDQNRETDALEQEIGRNEMSDNASQESSDQGYSDESSSDEGSSPTWEGEDNVGKPNPYTSNGSDQGNDTGGYEEEPLYEDEDNSYDDGSNDSEYSQEDNEFSEDSPFDGESFDGKKTVSPLVKDVTKKIVWRQEMLRRLKGQRAKMLQDGNNVTGIDLEISKNVDRVAELNNQLVNYQNEGSNSERNSRKKEVESALKKTTANLHEKHFHGKDGKGHGKGHSGGSETPTDIELNPKFSNNRIEIPAKPTSSFDGEEDFDYDTEELDGRPIVFRNDNIENLPSYLGDDEITPRVYEIKSNFTGSSKVNTKSILVGLVLGAIVVAGTVYAVKKGIIKLK